MTIQRMAKGSIQHNDFAKHILLCLIREKMISNGYDAVVERR